MSLNQQQNELISNELSDEMLDINLPDMPGTLDEVTHLSYDIASFKPLSLVELTEILGLTIKRDETNKVIAFLSQLSAYTEDSQINVSFNAPSSSGKSFIPIEISNLFPQEDVVKLGNCSPTAFYHEQGEYSKETNTIKIDLSRKIIIFLDQPSTQLLERVRSLLSHDEKIIKAKITDKSEKGGNRTKTVEIKGYPSVTFCTAGLRLDEQEATRFILLSPEINNEKIREAISEKIKKETDPVKYKQATDTNPMRKSLKDRILAIKHANVEEIQIGNPELVETLFYKSVKNVKPRHQRDIARVISIIKVLALLNMWFREKRGNAIISNEDDLQTAFQIWKSISESQELNLPPYVFNVFKDVIVTAYESKQRGLSRQEITMKHFEVYGNFLDEWRLRQQIIPMLETSGLITQEADSMDKRKMLIFPTTQNVKNVDNNSELGSGVEDSSYEAAKEIFAE